VATINIQTSFKRKPKWKKNKWNFEVLRKLIDCLSIRSLLWGFAEVQDLVSLLAGIWWRSCGVNLPTEDLFSQSQRIPYMGFEKKILDSGFFPPVDDLLLASTACLVLGELFTHTSYL
jgi:hypothetical protein